MDCGRVRVVQPSDGGARCKRRQDGQALARHGRRARMSSHEALRDAHQPELLHEYESVRCVRGRGMIAVMPPALRLAKCIGAVLSAAAVADEIARKRRGSTQAMGNK